MGQRGVLNHNKAFKFLKVGNCNSVKYGANRKRRKKTAVASDAVAYRVMVRAW